MAQRNARRSEALLLASRHYGEDSRVVTVLTRTDGILSLFARHAYKSRKRFGGTLQRCLLLDVSWIPPKRHGMANLAAARISESYWDLLSDLDRFVAADRVLELASFCLAGHDPEARDFDAVLALLRMCRDHDPRHVVRVAEAHLLHRAGWGPYLAVCRRCGGTTEADVRLFPPSGDVACRTCSDGNGVPLSADGLAAWKSIQEAGPETLPRVELTDRTARELALALPPMISWHAGVQARAQHR